MPTGPFVSKEQLNLRSLPNIPSVSLSDYTIDYDHPIGQGDFGVVYPLLQESQATNWCIKIPNWKIINPSLPGKLAWVLCTPFNGSILAEPPKHRHSNWLKQRYRVTHIQFARPCLTGQIMTRIQGKTLRECLEQAYLLDETQYLFRKALVDFLWMLTVTPLYFDDMRFDNLMYDEVNHRIEIVDGETRLKGGLYVEQENPLLTTRISPQATDLMTALYFSARNNLDYSEAYDSSLLTKVSAAHRKQYYQFPEVDSRTPYNVTDSQAHRIHENWCEQEYPFRFFSTFNKELVDKPTVKERREEVDAFYTLRGRSPLY